MNLSHSLADPAARNKRTGFIAACGALLMLGLGFASVPLYRIFCAATGFGGTPARASEAQANGVKSLAGHRISIRFDANVDPGMGWAFHPEVTTASVVIGARNLAFFEAENLTDRPITGQASYNISPDEAAVYFTKVQCFCFTRQVLAPHQKLRMPVSYYVDPKILADKEAKDVAQITLSYTFHPLPAGS
ncbi:MAG: cytochrome c oxidase subunit assembly protein [Pseudomonadota bacterium]|jgi:cytochrome c oxidase assembly protein subunit 11